MAVEANAEMARGINRAATEGAEGPTGGAYGKGLLR